ncbi:MAG TPA: PEP-CTERM sorting domain-containing protein [Verrucomicrobiae bacterium]|jgi:hypothetical protein
MKKLLITLTGCACLASGPVFAQVSAGNPLYDPFSDATGSGGTSYNTGSNLAGQTGASGQSWYDIGTGTSPQPTIGSGDLSVSGLASSGGGQSVLFGGNGDSARLNLTAGAGGITSGSVYFSFALKLTDLTGLTTAGTYWAGFNNSQGSATTAPGTIVTRVMTRKTTGGYNIGLQEGSSGSTFNTAWGSTVFTTSDTLFLVGSYTFNPATGDDISQLWIDPNASTFGDASAPTADLSSSGGVDIARIASFLIFDRSAAEPAGGQLDDLRVGLDWADVTPAATPEPSTMALGALALGGFYLLRRNK